MDAPSATAMNITRSTWGFKLPRDSVRNAVASAASGLSGDDPAAHSFYEIREDVRVTLGSGGRREVLTTSSRGGVTAGLRSAHASDPDFMRSVSADPATVEIGFPIPALEAAVLAAAKRASSGRRQVAWTARLVGFHQVVWVGRPDLDVVSDVRRGCRVELRVTTGSQGRATAVEDVVLDAGDMAPIATKFMSAFERAEAKSGTGEVPVAGETVAVFAPGVAGIAAHELIGHALEGDAVCSGRSWIRNGGLPAGPAIASVVDDPRRGRGAWSVDDEGTAAQHTCLIDRGRPVGLLLDRSTARLLARSSTGHGRRASHLDRIQPRMGCTYIEPGGDDPAEIVRSTSKGLFIRRLTGGHTDPESGRATFVVEDSDRIMGGRLAGPLDGYVIELTGPQSWKTIDRVGSDLAFDTCVGSCVRGGQPLAVSVGAPTIRIGLIRVCF